MPSFLPELTRRASVALAVAMLAVGVAPAAHAAAVSGQGTWETTLQGRDLDGNTATIEAYYDTALNITWLADASYAKTSNYFAAVSLGRMTWNEAKIWVAQLNINGTTGWRLPTIVDTGAAGCDFAHSGGTDCGFNVSTSTSELAHMYHVTLGNKSHYGASGYQLDFGLQNIGPFSNVPSGLYWSGLDVPGTVAAWGFDTYYGFQSLFGRYDVSSAWAVRTGDVAAAMVPEPSTYALALAGLAAMLVVRRRRHS